MAPRKTSGKRGSTQPSDRTKPSGQASDDTKGKKHRRAPVPQPHGGALVPGAGGGRTNGLKGGRPRSAIRADLLDSFDARRQFLDQVVAGELVTHLQVPLIGILPHIHCSGDIKDGRCAGKILPNDVSDLLLVNFRASASATVGDRLKALDTQAKYALGALKGVLQDQVEENVRKTLAVLKSRLSADQYELVAKELRPIWS
jgi:hypothetical protein